MRKINSVAELTEAANAQTRTIIVPVHKCIREAIRDLRPVANYLGGAFIEVDGVSCQVMYLG